MWGEKKKKEKEGKERNFRSFLFPATDFL